MPLPSCFTGYSTTMSEEKKVPEKRRVGLLIALVLVLALGAFLRFYQFPNWLHFELDQSRDARVVDGALTGGPGELTLLGMKAGGTSLRLGPGFYYLQYVSGLVFGATPVGVATFVPILSVISIFLFYLLIRRYFPEKQAIGFTLLFSVSAFLTMYGRFAWNPNPIPFFALLGFYSLLRSVEPEARHAGGWFLLSIFAIGFSTHLHFLAFLALPSITVAFLLIRRPRFPVKVWIAAVGIGILLYIPVILNEFSTGGANSQAFVRAVTEKSSKEEHSLAAKFVKDVSEHGLGFLVVVSGYEGGDFFTFKNGPDGFQAECDSGCRHGWPFAAASMLVFLSGAVSLVYLGWRERSRRKSDFLLLVGLWLLIPFVLFLPLAYGFAPRFFLVTVPVPFILLALLSDAVIRVSPWKKIAVGVMVLGIAFLTGTNLFYLWQRFGQLGLASYEPVKSPTDRILKERARVTLEQQTHIVQYLKERSDESGYPVYMWSEPEHRRALKYLMEKRDIQNDVIGLAGVYEEGIYVIILRSKSDLEDGAKKYRANYEIVAKRQFGTLTMIEFRPKPEAIQAKRQIFTQSGKVKDNPTALPRYTWSEWWNRRNDTGNDDSEDDQ